MPTPRLSCACAAGLLALAALPVRAEPVPSFVLSTGQYGMRKEVPHGLGIDFQVRAPFTWGVVRPLAGVLASSGGGSFVYSGLVADVDLPLGLRISPGFAPALALAKAQGDLGFALEFRSSLEVSAAATSRMRLALGFSHLSNARLGDHNPGVEVLTIGIAFPARR